LKQTRIILEEERKMLRLVLPCLFLERISFSLLSLFFVKNTPLPEEKKRSGGGRDNRNSTRRTRSTGKK